MAHIRMITRRAVTKPNRIIGAFADRIDVEDRAEHLADVMAAVVDPASASCLRGVAVVWRASPAAGAPAGANVTSRSKRCWCATIRAAATPSRSGPNHYVWEGTSYSSLSAIARTITGTVWNGPRFFAIKHAPGNDAFVPGRRARPPAETRPSARAGKTSPW
jgi:hypothetical protein